MICVRWGVRCSGLAAWRSGLAVDCAAPRGVAIAGLGAGGGAGGAGSLQASSRCAHSRKFSE